MLVNVPVIDVADEPDAVPVIPVTDGADQAYVVPDGTISVPFVGVTVNEPPEQTVAV